MEQIVLDCLAKDREHRPQSAAILAERLESCDATAWTAAHARSWWSERGDVLRASRMSGALSSDIGDTVAIDFAGRKPMEGVT